MGNYTGRYSLSRYTYVERNCGVNVIKLLDIQDIHAEFVETVYSGSYDGDVLACITFDFSEAGQNKIKKESKKHNKLEG